MGVVRRWDWEGGVYMVCGRDGICTLLIGDIEERSSGFSSFAFLYSTTYHTHPTT